MTVPLQICKNSSRVLLRHESDQLVLDVHQSRDSASTTTSPAGQVTSASLLVSITRRRVCMIDTILRHGSIPNIDQYLAISVFGMPGHLNTK